MSIDSADFTTTHSIIPQQYIVAQTDIPVQPISCFKLQYCPIYREPTQGCALSEDYYPSLGARRLMFARLLLSANYYTLV